MTKITFKVEVFREGNVYVAICPELDVSSFGDTVDEAKKSLLKAVEAFLEECERMGTLKEILEEAGFREGKDMWVPREPITEEKVALSF